VAAIKHPELREWLHMRIRCFYWAKAQSLQASQDASLANGTPELEAEAIPF
jgi:hypothetical protein